VVVVGFSVLLAAAQGFFYEMFSLGGVVLGYLLAAWGYSMAAAWYRPYASSPSVADVAGFLTVLLIVTLVGGVTGRLVRWVVHGAGLSWFDRLLGAAFGLVRGVLLVTVVALAIAAFAPQSRVLSESAIAPYLLVLGRGASWLAPAQVREQFRRGVEKVHRLQREKEVLARPAGRS
jgi:membrane protein required for colicin V production